MKPDIQALQVFYGTLPLILTIVGIWLRGQLLLGDILKRLGSLEAALNTFKDEVRGDLSKIKERLVALETRAGIVYRG
jgi:hypothetical protein